jgi:hypothetical protein
MNILSIEKQFRALDEKEKEIRQYFNPKSKKGKKHHYIADIRADFQYDTLLYGLGMFWLQESESSSEDLKIELPQNHSLPAAKLSTKKPPILAKRKNLGLLDLQKPLVKDHYEGIFSNTKYLNHDYLYKKPNQDLGKPGWKTRADQKLSVKNRAAREEMIYSARNLDRKREVEQKIRQFRSDYPEPLPKEADSVVSPEEFKEYLKQCKGIICYEKPFQKFNLDLAGLRKEQKITGHVTDQKMFRIFFESSTVVSLETKNLQFSATFTDLNVASFPTQTLSNLKNESKAVLVDLKQVFSYPLDSHTIRVLVQGTEESFDYYHCLCSHSEGLEEKIKEQIIQYKVLLYKNSKTTKDKVNPLTLQQLHLKFKPKLPKIESKPKTTSATRKKSYHNPITTALFSYKKNIEAFHPMAYPSNLSIFEAHDFIEENYPVLPKPKGNQEEDRRVSLEISGLGLNTTFS